MRNLKPCPFCGNVTGDESNLQRVELLSEDQSIWLDNRIIYYVKCFRCGAESGRVQTGTNIFGDEITRREAEEMAIRKWNRRNGEDDDAPAADTF